MKLRFFHWGNSIALRIPKMFLVQQNLHALVERITPENRHEATDWGTPVGKEQW